MNTYQKILSLLLAAVIVLPMTVVPSAHADSVSQQTIDSSCGTQTSISSNFNGNSIAGGNVIWFNSNFDLTSAATDGLTLYFTGQTITGNDFTASVPDSKVVFSSSVSSATTTFDTTSNMWVTTVPLSAGDDIFLSGLAYQVPASGLSGGENPVTWSGTISSSAPLSIHWKWGAAVYTSFDDYNSIGVKPIHSTSLDAYNNGDQAGTPENEKSNVIGGARGGGGSNWTGSWSATVSASSSCTGPPTPQVTLSVNAQLQNGTEIPGIFVELQGTSGNDIATGYTPTSFSVNSGQQYGVAVNNFDCYSFAYWLDTSATDNPRIISITSDTTLTAVYTFDCGNGGGGNGGGGTGGNGTGGGPPPNCSTPTSISSNFNGNSIAGGNVIWFNSNFDLTSTPTDGMTIFFTGQTITGNDFTASVPDSKVVFSSSVSSATTTFDTTSNMWVTTVPLSAGDDIFLSGLAYQVPAGGIPGGENPVTWSGNISGSAPFTMHWKWGAAVYTSFDDYNSIGVKPIHSTSLDAYNNGDQAGTPENEKSNVIGGARGGGGSNWTGSWSATVSASSSCTSTTTGGQVNLSINDVDMNGNAIAGLAVELQDTDGNTLVTNDSPATFSLNAGQTYNVESDSFGSCTFDHWSDTSATSDIRSVSISSDTSLTAVLRCS